MDPDLTAIQRHLLSLARQVDKRRRDFPSDWRPFEVANPREPGQQFNDVTAWELIVEFLASAALMRRVPQRMPSGAIAYEMTCCLEDVCHLYIKIRPGKKGLIFGRSFHYDERQS